VSHEGINYYVLETPHSIRVVLKIQETDFRSRTFLLQQYRTVRHTSFCFRNSNKWCKM
jgi:hypothetical protein